MAIEDKLSYCNLQGPVTIGVRRPHHKTSALATPGGFGLLYYLIVKDHRIVKTLCILRHAAPLVAAAYYLYASLPQACIPRLQSFLLALN